MAVGVRYSSGETVPYALLGGNGNSIVIGVRTVGQLLNRANPRIGRRCGQSQGPKTIQIGIIEKLVIAAVAYVVRIQDLAVCIRQIWHRAARWSRGQKAADRSTGVVRRLECRVALPKKNCTATEFVKGNTPRRQIKACDLREIRCVSVENCTWVEIGEQTYSSADHGLRPKRRPSEPKTRLEHHLFDAWENRVLTGNESLVIRNRWIV